MKVRSRSQLVQGIRRRIERLGYPRLQMLLIVSITGAVGFLASFGMLAAGVDTMWLRYPSAVLVAYLAFLCLLWLWLRTSAADYVDLPDPGVLPDVANLPSMPTFSGGGGGGGGAGAGSSFDGPSAGDALPAIDVPAGDAAPADLPSVGDAVAAAGDADEFAIPIVIIVLLAAMLLSSIWIVYTAPALFAELLLDGVLSTTLYRRLRRLESQHWLQTAVGRTVWVFLGLACQRKIEMSPFVFIRDVPSLGSRWGRDS